MREVGERYGIKGIKIWPFDGAAHRSRHQHIGARRGGPAPSCRSGGARRIRGSIEIMVELHSNWNLPSALRSPGRWSPTRPMWIEDVLLTGSLKDTVSWPRPRRSRSCSRRGGWPGLRVRGFASRASPATSPSDLRGPAPQPRPQVARAEAHQLPVGPHTAAGPSSSTRRPTSPRASLNVAIQESCQRFFERDWPAMLVDPICPSRAPWPPRISPGSACA